MSSTGTSAQASPHVSVLPAAVLRYAAPAPGQVWVDCTLGFAGHARRLLDERARVVGIECDGEALARARDALAPYGERARTLRGNFRDLGTLLDSIELGAVDGILADLGVSSWQLDQGARGFSFSHAGPVDMRLDPDGPRTALELLRELELVELTTVIRRYGEEPFARPVARALKRWVTGCGPFDTAAMARVVADAMPRRVTAKLHHHPATRTFQALRIAVNDELGALEALLEAMPDRLRPGGRAVIISFHSLEDRLVKEAFARWSGRRRTPAPRRGLPPPPSPPAAFELLTRKVVRADDDELADNPRARSARLRAVRKFDEVIA